MTPDIDGYAPLIDAVFRRDPNDPSHIPYRIADRSIKSDSPVIEAFQRVLALVGGRSSASEVLDLLTLDAVRRRFDIAPDEIEQLTQWVVESGTRWAIDADHRALHGQPAFNENTWRFGLNRLLLGYALPSDGHLLYEGVLPYDEIEGQNAALIGQLAEFCERLFEAMRDLSEPRTLARWRDDLGVLAERMLHQDVHTSSQHQRIRSALGELVDRRRSRELRSKGESDRGAPAARRGAGRFAPGPRFSLRRRDLLRDGADAQHSVPGGLLCSG